VVDPWGNRLIVLDSSKGSFVTDTEGVVLTNANGTPRLAPVPSSEA
jgi:hypothetical protein